MISTRFVRCAAALAVLAAASAQGAEKVRLAVGAGPLYPEKTETLVRVIREFYDKVDTPAPTERLVGCVVPHGGYGLSGQVTAYAFKHLKPGQYDTVIILAPSHHVSFEGCSIAACQAYVTPLGFVPVNGGVSQKLCRSALIAAHSIEYKRSGGRPQLHEVEHSIEVVLPFLQERIGFFTLVPILVGNLTNARGEFNPNRAAVVADTIRGVLTERTLLVVSTDFTHYGNEFSYRPKAIAADPLSGIEKLDQMAFRYVLSLDPAGFQNYLDQTGNPICGQAALHVFMRLIPKRAYGQLLAHDNSAHLTGNENQSVSYAAMQFYDPLLPPVEVIPPQVELRLPGDKPRTHPEAEEPSNE